MKVIPGFVGLKSVGVVGWISWDITRFQTLSAEEESLNGHGSTQRVVYGMNGYEGIFLYNIVLGANVAFVQNSISGTFATSERSSIYNRSITCK